MIIFLLHNLQFQWIQLLYLNSFQIVNEVYFLLQPIAILNKIMASDLQNTGTCHYTQTRETFWSIPAYAVLPKGSPHTESMSKG